MLFLRSAHTENRSEIRLESGIEEILMSLRQNLTGREKITLCKSHKL